MILAGRIWNRQLATYLPCEQVRDFGVPRNGFNLTGLWIFPKGMLFARGVTRNRYGEGGVAALRVSSNNHGFLRGVGRQGSQRLFAAVFQNERNCLAQVG